MKTLVQLTGTSWLVGSNLYYGGGAEVVRYEGGAGHAIGNRRTTCCSQFDSNTYGAAANKEVAGSKRLCRFQGAHHPGAVFDGSTDPAEPLLRPASRRTHPQQLEKRLSSEGAPSECVPFSSLLSSSYPSAVSHLVSAPAPRGRACPRRGASSAVLCSAKGHHIALSGQVSRSWHGLRRPASHRL